MIHIHLPWVPISANNAYATGRNGIRFLTKEGKTFKTEVKAHIARNYPLQYFVKNKTYDVVVLFTFQGRDTLECKGFDTGKAENRYKPLDAGNRHKLLEDALAEATNVDDRHYFAVTFAKRWHDAPDRTDIWIWKREEEVSPIHEFIDQLVRGFSS